MTTFELPDGRTVNVIPGPASTPRAEPEGGDPERRAAWALAALDTLGDLTGIDPDVELPELIAELICDLAHLADAHDLDPGELIEDGVARYTASALALGAGR